jgi:hypothetical protein
MPPATPELEPGERLIAEWRPDRGRYWRDHAVLGAVATVVAGVVLWALDMPGPMIGALGAAAAVAVRAAYLASETLGQVWRLTDRRLLLPGGRALAILEVGTARKLMGDVQFITRAGDKHLLKHQAAPEAVLAAFAEARTRRARRAG